MSSVFPMIRFCCAKLRCCREKQARDQEQEDALLSKLQSQIDNNEKVLDQVMVKLGIEEHEQTQEEE